MGRRTDLHDELKKLLGTDNCYFQPPSSLKLSYPCYVYKRERPDLLRANNQLYHRTHKYGVTYITLNPDDPLIEETESHFQMCRLVRSYAVDGLNHNYYDLFY